MKNKLKLIFIFLCNISFAQVFKITDNGILLVTDSISNKPITTTLFSNFKQTVEVYDYKEEDWLKENRGKYIKPTIEFDSLIVVKSNNKWGCITTRGKVVLKFKYGMPIYFFKNAKYFGFSGCETDGFGEKTCAYYVVNWKDSIMYRYGGFGSNYNNTFLMRRFGNGNYKDSLDWNVKKYGLINSNLDTILPFEYKCTSWDDKNFYFSKEGNLALKHTTSKKCGIMNYQAKIIVPFEYDYIDDPHFEYLNINKGNKWGLMNKKFKELLPINYDKIYCEPSKAFLAAILKDSKWQFLDSTLKLQTEQFDSYQNFISGKSFIVKKDNQYGIYDIESKNYILPLQFDSILCDDIFENEKEVLHFLVIKKGKYGLYDFKTRSFVINPHYELIQSFFSDDKLDKLKKYYYATNNNRATIFNYDLKAVINAHVDSVATFSGENYFIITKGLNYYLVKDSTTVLAGPYDKILPVNAPYGFKTIIIVKKNNKYGWINDDGTLVQPIGYDKYCSQAYFKTFRMIKNKMIYYYDKNKKLVKTKKLTSKDDICNDED